MSEEQTIEGASHVGTVEAQYLVPLDAVPVAPADHPRGNGRFLVVRNGYEVREIDGPMRVRRRHEFHDVAGFAAWLNRHAKGREEKAEILVAETGVGAVLFGEDRTPDPDVVTCKLNLHPIYKAWRGSFGVVLEQEELHAFVVTQAEALGEQAAPFALALQQLKVATATDFNAELDPLGYLKVVGGTGRQEASVKLPPTFQVTLPVIEGVRTVDAEGELGLEARYTLQVFLRAIISGDGPAKRAAFKLTCLELELVERRSRRDAAAYLQALLETGFLVGLGKVDIEDVLA